MRDLIIFPFATTWTTKSSKAIVSFKMTRSRSMPMLLLCFLSHCLLRANAAETASDSIESLFDSAKGYKISGSVLAITAIAVGVVMVTMGYRFLRAALFAVGFVVGGVVVAVVVENIFESLLTFVLQAENEREG